LRILRRTVDDVKITLEENCCWGSGVRSTNILGESPGSIVQGAPLQKILNGAGENPLVFVKLNSRSVFLNDIKRQRHGDLIRYVEDLEIWVLQNPHGEYHAQDDQYIKIGTEDEILGHEVRVASSLRAIIVIGLSGILDRRTFADASIAPERSRRTWTQVIVEWGRRGRRRGMSGIDRNY